MRSEARRRGAAVGSSSREIAPLVSAYFELVLGNLDARERVQLAVGAALGLDRDRLHALAAAVSDAHPWQPFFRVLVAARDAEPAPRLSNATARLYDLASTMLRDLGCEVVRPEDLLLRETPLERAVQVGLRPEL